MAKFKVETVGAIIDRLPIGSEVTLEEKSAKRLESQGYVRIIEEVKKPKKASAPKKSSKPTAKKVEEKVTKK